MQMQPSYPPGTMEWHGYTYMVEYDNEQTLCVADGKIVLMPDGALPQLFYHSGEPLRNDGIASVTTGHKTVIWKKEKPTNKKEVNKRNKKGKAA
jgi:hypothetical protein